MKYEDLSMLSREDQLLALAFGDKRNPPLGRFPHVIFPTRSESLRLIMDEIGAIGGVWGVDPLYDRNGKSYIPENEESPQNFVLWALPENQQMIKSGCLSHAFHCILDCDISPETLKKMYSARQGDGEYYYYDYINYLADWMDELQWAYIPLENECDYSMFVVCRSRAGWVANVSAALHQIGETIIQLEPNGDHYRWVERSPEN